MKVFDTEIPDVKIIEPTVFTDNRGYFFEAFNAQKFSALFGFTPNFCQLNESGSELGTIRGLHLQTEPHAQAKLVRVVSGRALDVVVDCRKSSPHFGKHVTIDISEENKRQVWIPRGFAHGFQVMSKFCTLSYQVDAPYSPHAQKSINAFDNFLKIGWCQENEVKMSSQDECAPNFLEIYG